MKENKKIGRRSVPKKVKRGKYRKYFVKDVIKFYKMVETSGIPSTARNLRMPLSTARSLGKKVNISGMTVKDYCQQLKSK
jgi:hypothetical protein